MLRADIYELLFGVFWAVLGIASIALSFLRWRTKDRALISFGIFCLLYGARTRASHFFVEAPTQFWGYWGWSITYCVPIAAWIFVEQLLGKGWKSSIRWLWQLQIVFAITAIAVDIYQHHPGTAMLANNSMAIFVIIVVLINLFRPGLEINRELRVLRVGFITFALLALHSNIRPFLTTGYIIQDLEPLGFLFFIG